MGHQLDQELVAGLLQQGLQRGGVGGVAGLDLLGLRQAKLLEEHRLQLLGRTEVDLVADGGKGLLLGVVDHFGEVRELFVQALRGDGDAREFHLGQDPCRPAAPTWSGAPRPCARPARVSKCLLRACTTAACWTSAPAAAPSGPSPSSSSSWPVLAAAAVTVILRCAGQARRARSCGGPAGSGSRKWQVSSTTPSKPSPRWCKALKASLNSCMTLASPGSRSHLARTASAAASKDDSSM